MPINVKLINQVGTISTHTIHSDDPSDSEIISLLGGSEDSGLSKIKRIGDWEIVKISDSDSNILIIGAPPYISDDPKSRLSCNLTDEEIKNLLSFQQ